MKRPNEKKYIALDWTNTKQETSTVLQVLENAHVFEIEKTEQGNFNFTELCDNYYQVELTREMLIDLANELLELAK